MTVTSRASILAGNQNAAPVIPMSARALDGWAVLAPALDAVSAKRLQSNIILGPDLNRVSATYLRAEMIVDSMVTRTLIDSLYRPTGYDFDAFDDQVYNLSAGPDYKQWCVSEDPIPNDGETYYFEVATISGSMNMDGYIGVTQESLVAANYDAGVNLGQNSGEAGYRGNGSIWADGSQRVSSIPSYGNGTRVRIAFNPSSGAMWVGANETWHRNPATDSPSYTIPDAGVAFRVALQCRNQDDRAHLLGREQQFRYPTPTGCFPLKS